MNRKLIVVLLTAVGLTAGVAVADPTGVSSTEGVRKPAAAQSTTDSPRPMLVAGPAPTAAADDARIAPDSPAAAGLGRSESQPARAHRNSPHPAVLSHSHPVYPIGVPLPPVSLERY